MVIKLEHVIHPGSKALDTSVLDWGFTPIDRTASSLLGCSPSAARSAYSNP